LKECGSNVKEKVNPKKESHFLGYCEEAKTSQSYILCEKKDNSKEEKETSKKVSGLEC